MDRREILRSLFFRTPSVKASIYAAVPATSVTEKTYPSNAGRFRTKWQLIPGRAGTCEDFYTQDPRDWAVQKGEVMCMAPGANKLLGMLTRQIPDGNSPFSISLIFRFLNQPCRQDGQEDFAGFRLGMKVRFQDRHSAKMEDQGIDVGVTRDGYLFIGKTFSARNIDEIVLTRNTRLQLVVTPLSTGGNFAKLKALDAIGNTVATVNSAEHNAIAWQGNIALISHFKADAESNGLPTIAVSKFEIEGEKIY